MSDYGKPFDDLIKGAASALMWMVIITAGSIGLAICAVIYAVLK